jgi:hypothetical protein
MVAKLLTEIIALNIIAWLVCDVLEILRTKKN